MYEIKKLAKGNALKRSCAALMLSFGLNAVYADIQGIGEAEGWLLGATVNVDYSGYKQTDQPSLTPFPYVAFEWENAHIGIDELSYDFYQKDALSLTAMLQPRWSSHDKEDSPVFDGIERDTSVEAGLAAMYQFSRLYVEGTLLQDVSGVHKGHMLTIKLGKGIQLARTEFDIGIGVSYRDSKLNSHLYGVSQNEARNNRVVFNPDAAFTPYIELELIRQLSPATLLVAMFDYEFYSDEIKKSPLIGHAGEGNITLGAVYQF